MLDRRLPPAWYQGRDVRALRGALDAVDVCVSPRIGARQVDVLADRGVRFVFAQPGADGEAVLAACRRRGVVVQRGCVLVDEWPPRS